jgi:hypothetical protein
VILTSMQHRKLAKFLRESATKLPPEEKDRANRMHQSASLHLGLARTQESNPSLAPAAKNLGNHEPPRERSSKPRLASSMSLV